MGRSGCPLVSLRQVQVGRDLGGCLARCDKLPESPPGRTLRERRRETVQETGRHLRGRLLAMLACCQEELQLMAYDSCPGRKLDGALESNSHHENTLIDKCLG